MSLAFGADLICSNAGLRGAPHPSVCALRISRISCRTTWSAARWRLIENAIQFYLRLGPLGFRLQRQSSNSLYNAQVMRASQPQKDMNSAKQAASELEEESKSTKPPSTSLDPSDNSCIPNDLSSTNTHVI